MTRFRHGVILLACFWYANCTVALGQGDYKDIDTDGLVIEATAGWDGTVDGSFPVPISLLVNNYSEDAIEGELVLMERHGRRREVSLGSVFVSPNSTRQLTSIQNLSGWYECVARIRAGERILWQRQLSLNTGEAFFSNVNFALFIDAAGRKLSLPGATSSGAATSSEMQVAAKDGRPIRCLTVKHWQVPNHCGPMSAAQVIVLPERMDSKSLNRAQWRALAEWVCQGGTMFVHAKTEAVLQKLLEVSPLPNSQPVSSGSFQIRSMGLGSIYEYSPELLSSEGTSTRQQIARLTSLTPKQHIASTLQNANFQERHVQVNRNYGVMLAMFVLYSLLSGVVTLVLFRLSRQQVAIYTVCVVLGASIAAAMIGGLLRSSQGDLNWHSVMAVGPSGAVQVARLGVQSAGSRNQTIAVKGNQPDVQYSGIQTWHYWQNSYMSWRPFAWQPDLDKDKSDTFRTQIPMTPFGRRWLQAVDYVPAVPRLDLSLEFDEEAFPKIQTDEASGKEEVRPTHEVTGKFRATVKNNLSKRLRNCYLLIGATANSIPQAALAQQPRYRYRNAPPLGLVDVYCTIRFPDLNPAGEHSKAFQETFRYRESQWDMVLHTGNGSILMPRIGRLGTATAWFVGELEASPSLSIDRQQTEFVPQSGFHLFVQEIPPEEMPDLSIFHKSK